MKERTAIFQKTFPDHPVARGVAKGATALVLSFAAATLACGAGSSEVLSPAGTNVESLAVTSRSFPSGGQIPVDCTCDGADRSPQLTWSAPPAGTRSFVVVVEDIDGASGTFTHWIAYDISAEARSLPEAVDLATVDAASGLNDFKRPGYLGPCPPQLEFHRYYFRVLALDSPLRAGPEPDRGALDAALRGHVLAAGALVGSFSH